MTDINLCVTPSSERAEYCTIEKEKALKERLRSVSKIVFLLLQLSVARSPSPATAVTPSHLPTSPPPPPRPQLRSMAPQVIN